MQATVTRSRRVWLFIRPIIIAVILGLLLNRFVIQRNAVIGHSMLPTLEDGDQIIVEKITRLFPSGLERGDIVTIDLHEQVDGEEVRVVKRVVGLPGEYVLIQNGKVFINGKALAENYLFSGEITEALPTADITEVHLAEDEYFVLGDNRGHSRDSRQFGAVARRDILGKLLIRILPLSKFGKP